AFAGSGNVTRFEATSELLFGAGQPAAQPVDTVSVQKVGVFVPFSHSVLQNVLQNTVCQP
ncbi:MAG: hypothetical protein VCB14_04095, partial [Alphaproteobacteria bacterium]